MLKRKYLVVALACASGFALAGSALADDEQDDKGRNCVQTRTLKSTAVVDDYNVLFVRKGNSVLHNLLPRECRGLSVTKQFSYKTTGGSLCSQDTIRVINTQGRESTACPLGKFYEIDTEQLRALVADPAAYNARAGHRAETDDADPQDD